LVTGAGAVARNSIGIVLVGGMAIGTLFTLFVVPSLYVLIAQDHHRSRAEEPEPARVPSQSGHDLTPDAEPELQGTG
jgi:multidrug efflux pump